MPDARGREFGVTEEAWRGLQALGVRTPWLDEDGKPRGRGTIVRLLGFWVVCMLDDFDQEQIIASGLVTRDGFYRQRAEFSQVFGCRPDEFVLMPLQAALPGLAELLPGAGGDWTLSDFVALEGGDGE